MFPPDGESLVEFQLGEVVGVHRQLGGGGRFGVLDGIGRMHGGERAEGLAEEFRGMMMEKREKMGKQWKEKGGDSDDDED